MGDFPFDPAELGLLAISNLDLVIKTYSGQNLEIRSLAVEYNVGPTSLSLDPPFRVG